ncbi:acylphosphatase [Shewanella loihica]|uniref:Acylphosphatase n=1 Tax=Shewanella loihica (strain ATCC BAA-1088 / PV-4) TaxID=323850 RepID=A3QDE7_SHELP|nr:MULTISPECIES: acylphosphatase [Shewanella]ABO23495.1 acylphosphatase [Shewanella loihica PV-4]KIO35226.1 acylphosphatase [Shewanella sp. cp20]MCG9722847.1 acylphosphatase [Shewanella sp. Isolate7]MCG9746148.1 acylphosphatase [Shewanella sp. Isolate8]MCL2910250.1 acylphosphatase [Shewanella aquimarina]
MKRVLLTISGKVQGVCFRRYSQLKANELGLTGYAKNLEDGRVLILLQGGGLAVDRFIAWSEQGSPQSVVDNVLVEEDEADEIYLDFSVY